MRNTCELIFLCSFVSKSRFLSTWFPIFTSIYYYLFVKKLIAPFLFRQAAAYYYHGMILDEGNTEKSHGMAVAALQAAEEFLKESKKSCEAFNSTPPTSRFATVHLFPTSGDTPLHKMLPCPALRHDTTFGHPSPTLPFYKRNGKFSSILLEEKKLLAKSFQVILFT